MALDYKDKGDAIKAEDWNSIVAVCKGEQDPSQEGYVKTNKGCLFTKDQYSSRPSQTALPECFLQVRDTVQPLMTTRNWDYDTSEYTRSFDIILGTDLTCALDALDADAVLFVNALCDDYSDCNSLLSSTDFQMNNAKASNLSCSGRRLFNDGWVHTGIQRPLSALPDGLFGTYFQCNISSNTNPDPELSSLSGTQMFFVFHDCDIKKDDWYTTLSVQLEDTFEALNFDTTFKKLNTYTIAKRTEAIDKASQLVQITLGGLASQPKLAKEPWDIEGKQFKRAYWQIGCDQGECQTSSYILDYSTLSTVYCTMDLVNISATITDRSYDDPQHYSAPVLKWLSGEVEYVNRHPIAPVWGNYLV